MCPQISSARSVFPSSCLLAGFYSSYKAQFRLSWVDNPQGQSLGEEAGLQRVKYNSEGKPTAAGVGQFLPLPVPHSLGAGHLESRHD